MSTESKVRIYKTCVRSVLTYAAETRAEISYTKRLLKKTKIKVLRSIREISLRHRIRNKDTLKDTSPRCGEMDTSTTTWVEGWCRQNGHKKDCEMGKNTKIKNRKTTRKVTEKMAGRPAPVIAVITEKTGSNPQPRRRWRKGYTSLQLWDLQSCFIPITTEPQIRQNPIFGASSISSTPRLYRSSDQSTSLFGLRWQGTPCPAIPLHRIYNRQYSMNYSEQIHHKLLPWEKSCE